MYQVQDSEAPRQKTPWLVGWKVQGKDYVGFSLFGCFLYLLPKQRGTFSEVVQLALKMLPANPAQAER
jgi:hypothetical protein